MDTKDPMPTQDDSSAVEPKAVTRRRFSVAQKREMVEATLDGKTSVSVIARQYDVNANQLFRWRKQYHDGQLGDTAQAKLLPVKLSDADNPVTPTQPMSQTALSGSGTVEIHLSNDHRIVMTGSVCQQSLKTILQVLS